MDSKEILETFGISRNFGIVLFIQSIIVIIGCFFALQAVYVNSTQGNLLYSFRNILSLLFFLVLLFYSFYGFRKNETYFKWVLYLYGLILAIGFISAIISGVGLLSLFKIIELIIVVYLILNLNNYSKAKITVLLLVLVELIRQIYFVFIGSIPIGFLTVISLIPCVSIALTYFARYNDKGFKILL